MLRLQAITVENYRSFARPTTLELRPLTLLYGRNNAGKSALLSLLPMLSAAVSEDAAGPFPTRDPAGTLVHFKGDLIWKGSRKPEIQFTLHWKEDEKACIRDRIALYYEEVQGRPERVVIQSLSIENEDGSPMLEALRVPPRDGSVPEDPSLDWPYRLRFSNQPEDWKPFTFNGLLVNDAFGMRLLEEQRERLKSLRGRVQWLGSVRAPIPRHVEKSGVVPPKLGPDGTQAAEVVLHRPDVFEDVRQWYADPAIGRELRTVPVRHPFYELQLTPMGANHWDIPIQQTGEGMSQVFSILVASAMAHRGKGQRALVVEEPESHLHGDAQVALAKHLARIAASPDAPIVLLETHSRLLLLGVQLAVARGEIPPDCAGAYWIDQQADMSSEALPVRFTLQGKLEGWPMSALQDDMNLARELLDIELSSMSGHDE